MENQTEQHNPTETTATKFGIAFSHGTLGEVLLPHLAKLWMFRRKLVIINGVVLLLALVYLLIFAKPYFESTITILPDYGSKSSILGGLSGLAAMAGVSIGDNATPVDVYQNLLGSESVVENVVRARYQTHEFKDSVDLYQYFKMEPDNNLLSEVRKRKMFVDLHKEMTKTVISTKIDIITKILNVTVRMPESKLSADVANKLVESLDEYVRTKQKTNASEKRTYIEKRVSEVKDSMRTSEDNLVTFQQANRVTSQSAELALEQSRLTLQVQILQGVYSELIRQLEIAKIDEIKDAPIINIREWASEPVIKSGPKRLAVLLLIMLVSVFFSIFYLLVSDQIVTYLRKIARYERSKL